MTRVPSHFTGLNIFADGATERPNTSQTSLITASSSEHQTNNQEPSAGLDTSPDNEGGPRAPERGTCFGEFLFYSGAYSDIVLEVYAPDQPDIVEVLEQENDEKGNGQDDNSNNSNNSNQTSPETENGEDIDLAFGANGMMINNNIEEQKQNGNDNGHNNNNVFGSAPLNANQGSNLHIAPMRLSAATLHSSAADRDIARFQLDTHEAAIMGIRNQGNDSMIASLNVCESDEFAPPAESPTLKSVKIAESNDVENINNSNLESMPGLEYETKQYRLHRKALQLCDFFKAQLSARWKGNEISKIIYKTQISIQIVEKCLMILYYCDFENGTIYQCNDRNNNTSMRSNANDNLANEESKDVLKMNQSMSSLHGCGNNRQSKVIRNVSEALQALTVFCDWHYEYGIQQCTNYLKKRLTSYNVSMIRETAEYLQRSELLNLCQTQDPSCNLLSVIKMKEILDISVKYDTSWAKMIAEKEFIENANRSRVDINASFMQDLVCNILSKLKYYSPLKGDQWLNAMIECWLPPEIEFNVWRINSDSLILQNFQQIMLTNPKEYQIVKTKIISMLNNFIQRFFVAKNGQSIKWHHVLRFLQSWSKQIEPNSLSAILEIAPPKHQASLCEFCIDFMSKSVSLGTDQNDLNWQVVLESVMKCQEKAKFWEKSQSSAAA